MATVALNAKGNVAHCPEGDPLLVSVIHLEELVDGRHQLRSQKSERFVARDKRRRAGTGHLECAALDG